MKPNLSSLRRAVQKLGCLALVASGLLALPAHAANPNIAGTLATVRVLDTESTNLFDAAVVSEGDTNLLTVYVDFAPTNYGTLLPLPSGVVQSGTNFLIAATNGTMATTIFTQLLFTATANVIPVPNFSNVTFHAYVIDARGSNSLTRSTTVRITATNDPNTLTASGTTNINDKQTAAPFRNVTVTDPDDGGDQPQTATVTLNGVSHGYLDVSATGFASNNLAYTFTGTPTEVTNELAGLVFVPRGNFFTPGTTDTTTFTLRVSDGYITRTNSAVTVATYSTNDAPTLTASGVFTITDKQTAKPFASAVVTDPDLSATQAQVITVTLDSTNNGYLDIGSSGFSSNNFVYTFSNSPAGVTAAVSNLVFVPLENILPVGLSNTTTFTVQVTDGYVTRTNSAVQVVAISTNDIPQLTGVTAPHIPVEIGNTIYPFSFLTFIDPDHNDSLTDTNGQDLDWQVALTGPSPLGELASGGSPVGSTFSASGGAVAATVGLRDLSYIAPTLAITGTNTLKLAITADDGHGGTVSNNVFLDLYSLVSPPGLSGMQSGQTVNDNSTVAAFSKVSIQSFNGSAVTIRIALAGGVTNDAQGQLINLGSFSKTTVGGAPSVYSFTGTSEAATAAIRALLFQPVANRIGGGSTDTARFGLTLIDGIFTNAPDTSTTVIIVPVNDTPVLAGLSALVTIQDNQTLPPFPTVLITDADEGGQQRVSATITLDVAAKGSFSTNSLAASGFTNTGAAYVFTGTSAALTTAIRQLVFVPTPGRVAVGLTETTVFTIVLNDSYGGFLANSSTAVRVASVSGLPVVNVPTPQPVSIPIATNIYPFQAVTISDPTLLQVNVRINSTAQGAFTTNSVTSTGFTNRGGGVYFISGLASNVTAALQALDFSPAPSLPFGATINFTISVTNALPNFVSVNHAVVLRTVRNSFIVTKLTDYDPNGSVPANQKEGTLRKAIADAKNNDHITFDIRSGVVGQPDYPAVIHLQVPLYIYNNLTFDGPGADRLTISGDSDLDGDADVQLFNINAAVTMNRLAFTLGHDSFAGGAFEVGMDGDLVLSYCAVTDSSADIWGGGIDVTAGKLTMDHCLVRGNRTSTELGQGGGGISLYTEQPCTIVSTTFATNRQNAIAGLGGGALYAETIDSGVQFNVHLLSCTFHDNVDAAGHGSSIRPNVFNTFVQLQNTIVADGSGRNLEMDESGLIVSLGGNISDDATATTYSIGGPATNNYIFHPPADQINIPATNLLAALASNGGPTPTFALTSGSSAIGNAFSNTPSAAFYATLGTDQRGYFRDHSPDIGAFERLASQRVIIEEIGFNPAPPRTNDEFIEFYVPRDSAALNLGGFQVLVDGVLRHTFTNQNLQPGEALVLFSSGAVSNGVPSGVYRQIASTNLQLDNAGGLVT
ncbi:MAG: lamin tail domain-containing protein, partial [Verrucomicrobia bacterium]|nr:lamin tail domain-containing protein [Verrucomicrobiota bacterium]